MTALGGLKAGVVGTGFIGAVHVDALRPLGVEVLGVVGSTPERATAKDLAPAYESLEALLDDERVDVVHLTTPNNLHYPMVQEARERFRAGELGEVWSVHGGYLQDWLALPTDWNWRLEPERAGDLRAVRDIGSHWMDLTQSVAGSRIVEVFADLATSIPVRKRPKGEVETFASANDVEREDADMSTEDVAHILLRVESGARGSLFVSQVAMGHKNSLRFEIDGSAGSIAWDSERNEELWLGHRDRPNETLLRNAAPMHPAAAARTHLPVAHAEGFADTFRELYRAVYADVACGTASDEPDYPTFRDGHVENVLCDAVAVSNRERRWVEVPT